MMMGLGSIIGTGIFVSIGIAAEATGPSVTLAIADQVVAARLGKNDRLTTQDPGISVGEVLVEEPGLGHLPGQQNLGPGVLRQCEGRVVMGQPRANDCHRGTEVFQPVDGWDANLHEQLEILGHFERQPCLRRILGNLPIDDLRNPRGLDENGRVRAGRLVLDKDGTMGIGLLRQGYTPHEKAEKKETRFHNPSYVPRVLSPPGDPGEPEPLLVSLPLYWKAS